MEDGSWQMADGSWKLQLEPSHLPSSILYLLSAIFYLPSSIFHLPPSPSAMRRWILPAFVLAAVLAAGFWVWHEFFPPPERVIRLRLKQAAALASYSAKEAPAAKLFNSQKLAGFFTSDVVLRLNIPGYSQMLTGRDDLAQAALLARQHFTSFSAEFSDVLVTVAPDKQSAVVNLTAKASSPGEMDFFVQELKLSLKRDGRDWLISRVETVKTLR
jgi:hypothetical protein